MDVQTSLLWTLAAVPVFISSRVSCVCVCVRAWRLIEEFMLLANMAVAHHITDKFHQQAVLRRHPPPKTRMVNELVSCPCLLI